MFERLKHMLIKEFSQIFRDPKMRMVVFFPPVIQLFIFGYAATTDVHHAAMAIYDLDYTVSSRELASRFSNSEYFDIVEYVADERKARDLIDRGKVQVILRMNKGFEEDLEGGRTAQLQVILDGTDSNTARIAVDYIVKIARQFSDDALAARLSRLGGDQPRLARVELRARAWFNENLESRNFYIPGVIAMILMLVTIMLSSMSVVREREIGTMEQIMVTPITPLEFILGKTLPFALIGFLDLILVLVVAVFWFEVPVRGSVPLLFLGAALFLMSTLGVGLLISTVSHTQQQAQMSGFFFFQPSIILSGFIFPIANMPEVVQWITYLNPLRYFLVIIRGVFLKGVGMSVLWPEMCALAALGVSLLGLAATRLKKTLA